jgi:hypothetical protein
LIWKSDSEPAYLDPHFEMIPAIDGVGVVLKLLNFDSSQLLGIKIRQVAPIQQANLACLQYDSIEKNWIVLYNSLDRIKQIREQIELLLVDKQYSKLRQSIIYLFNGEIKQAEKTIDSDLILQSLFEENNWIPSRFNLDYVLHGLKKTFRHWTKSEKQLYLQDAIDVMEVLRNITPNVCVFGGAALGWLRSGELIDHDDDLDIVICMDRKKFPDIASALEMVTQTLKVAGWETTGTFFSCLWVSTHSKVTPTLDVFIGLVEGNNISCYPMPRGALKLDRMFPAQNRTLCGMQVLMPKDLEHYFEVDYGPQWQTPEKGYSIEWDRGPYADIAGKRKNLPMSTRRELEFLRKIGWMA